MSNFHCWRRVRRLWNGPAVDGFVSFSCSTPCGVDRASDIVNELDDQFGQTISRRGLAREQKRPRREGLQRTAFDLTVQRKDMQCVQMLALVFVKALYLHFAGAVMGVAEGIQRAFPRTVFARLAGRLAPATPSART